MKWWPNTCKSGDMIRVRIGAIYHYGIFVSEDEVIQFGYPPTMYDGKSLSEVKVISTDIQTFSCGSIVEVAVPENPTERKRFSPRKTIKLAKSRLGSGGYDLIHNNCEHFVYQCVYGESRSTQADEVRKRWLNRPILNVYIMPYDGIKQIAPVYPPKRQQEIEGSSGELCVQKYAAWKALEYGLLHSFHKGMRELSFDKAEDGKWICKEYGISISHTDTAVAVAVANSEVGVDIESISAFEPKYNRYSENSFFQKICTEKEAAGLADGSLSSFLRLWTRKESIFKRDGKGNFIPEEIATDISGVRTETFELCGDGFVMSVCSDKADHLNCYLITDGTPHRIKTTKI